VKALVAAAIVAATAGTAHAFCGFYVAGGDQQMFNDATQVVLMRDGTRTVLSMQNNYKGPPDAFAMIIPVPVVLHEGDVKTLPKDVFERVEKMGAPRLVEYWEQDPCAIDEYKKEGATAGSLMLRRAAAAPAATHSFGVTIEAKFVVGEYQIVILSAKDSTGLDGWLRAEKYNIPDGAEPLLRPYVESGMKFFVAKVDPAKVTFENGRAALSPLRFFYDDERFELPIRLGIANSSGTQDLIVNILAPNQRYEVANYPNVTIPTNLDVKDSVKDKFGAFYAALFDATVEKHPGAAVTEYAWQATTCDPCPGPTLNMGDFQLLGADVIHGARSQQASPTTPMNRRRPPGYGGYGYDMVLTRLHMRYGKDLKDDLVFRAADPIVGGREYVVDQGTGRLEEGARTDATNNFQGRYVIRHPWTGPIACTNPRRHIWGGPPNGGYAPPIAATNLAFAARGQVRLQSVVNRDVPEIGIVASEPVSNAVPPQPVAPQPAVSYAPAKTNGCSTSNPADLGAGLALLGFAFARSRRRAARQ
jgi:MYXO-CTERM domain-containing protein